jgi:K(+)-stimulated pyrophosphate-energized sodium pump
VALITFILLAVKSPDTQAQLLVWIFVMRVAMLISSSAAYFLNGAIAKAKYANSDEMDFEAPLTSLVWITSIVSIGLTYVVTYLMLPNLAGDPTLWWKLASIISCGTLAGALIPELVKVFTSTNSAHVQEVVTSAKEGGASLGILSGLVAGNMSAYWLGLSMVGLGLFLQPRPGHGCHDAGSRRVRLWPGCLRLPGHGTGYDCSRLLRSGYRQRSIRL